MRHEFTDHERAAIKPMLPNKPRGVPRVNDRRVLNGIFWVLRSAHRGAICRRRSAPIRPKPKRPALSFSCCDYAPLIHKRTETDRAVNTRNRGRRGLENQRWG